MTASAKYAARIYEKIDRMFLDLIIRWPKSSDLGPNSDGQDHQVFKSKNGLVSELQDVIHNSKQQQNDRLIRW